MTHLPLQELWRDDGFSTSTRGRPLNHDEIRHLLRSGPVQFVIAEVGFTLRWIPTEKCFDFWKDEAKAHLATAARVVRDDFPGAYFYFASHWDGPKSEGPIIVMERHH